MVVPSTIHKCDDPASSTASTVVPRTADTTKPSAAGPPRKIPPQGYERVDLMGRRRRFFSAAECSLHKHEHDCWLIAHGKVYDVTEFIPKHPAGSKAIVRKGGKDATTDFDFHSSRARKMWAPLLLGYAEPPGGGADADCVIS